MNREEIKKDTSPIREPMLLVDEVELVDRGNLMENAISGGDEYFLQGHFGESRGARGHQCRCWPSPPACC